MGKQKITMTIDAEIFAKFKKFCKARGMKVSSKVELMMGKVLEEGDEKQ